MYKELSTNTVMVYNMRIVRPASFVVDINKVGKRLGCGLAFRDALVEITGIEEEGAVMEHNRKASADRLIKVSDCISAANGVSGSANDIYKKIIDNQQLKLTIERFAT